MWAGIDYSLSRPAICISTTEECAFKDCKFFYLTNKKKYEGTWTNIYGDLHKEWKTPEERYHNISSWAMRILRHEYDVISIEDYSMGSRGRVFHIGENAGILKYRLWKNKHHIQTISPSEVKKFATGKGNADKQMMYDSFYNEHKYDIRTILGQDTLDSPITDIVDAYYVCKTGINI